MRTVAVICFSGSGHTAKLAEAVAKGARSVKDVQVSVTALSGTDIVNGRYKNGSVLKIP